MKHVTAATVTIFLRSDTTATIRGWRLIFGKHGDINDGWIRYIQVRR